MFCQGGPSGSPTSQRDSAGGYLEKSLFGCSSPAVELSAPGGLLSSIIARLLEGSEDRGVLEGLVVIFYKDHHPWVFMVGGFLDWSCWYFMNFDVCIVYFILYFIFFYCLLLAALRRPLHPQCVVKV